MKIVFSGNGGMRMMRALGGVDRAGRRPWSCLALAVVAQTEQHRRIGAIDLSSCRSGGRRRRAAIIGSTADSVDRGSSRLGVCVIGRAGLKGSGDARVFISCEIHPFRCCMYCP